MLPLTFALLARADDGAAAPSPAPTPLSEPVPSVGTVPGETTAALEPTPSAAIAPPTPEPTPSAAIAPPPPVVPPPEAIAPPPPVVPPPAPGVGLALDASDPFAIHDRAGRRYTTVQFARLVNDETTLRDLESRQDGARLGTASLAATGAVVLLGALLVATGDGDAPDPTEYEPDPVLYDTKKEYSAAQDFGDEQYGKATEAWNEQKVASALFLAGTGGILLVVAPFFGRDILAREEFPHKAYSRDQAKSWVEKYNAAHPPVEIVPVVGPGSVGLSGTF